MEKDVIKKKVGLRAINYVRPGSVIGVGTGSTILYFINALKKIKNKIKGVVSSSLDSTIKLKKIGLPILDINKINKIDLYIDSADEINYKMQMIKGGGAALTNEKIIASISDLFICIVDYSKLVKVLGKFPLPIEIIPMAKSLIFNKLKQLGGIPKQRPNTITENGNIIIDVYNFMIIDAIFFEETINNIPGVVTVGIFAKRTADIVLVGVKNGIKVIQ
ncbi:MAG: ribose-5-phosphate isomerase RpiA [Enterobacteriaceae bacterium]